jgi:hypothetical protein
MFRRPGLIITTTLAVLAAAVPPADAASGSEVIDVAHRGASAYVPENTVAAFKLARAQHARMFELDVQETKDHQLILMHDTSLARTTNVEDVYPHRSPWRVRDFTLAQIKKLDAGSWFSPRYSGVRPARAQPSHGDLLLGRERRVDDAPAHLLSGGRHHHQQARRDGQAGPFLNVVRRPRRFGMDGAALDEHVAPAGVVDGPAGRPVSFARWASR